MSTSGEMISNTYNVFIDSQRTKNARTGTGDNFILPLGSAGVGCGQGQYLRLTLNNFSMYKNFSDVNTNNSQIVCRTGAVMAAGQPAAIGERLEWGDYTTRNALAFQFAYACIRAFTVIAQTLNAGAMVGADALYMRDEANSAIVLPVLTLKPGTGDDPTNNVLSFVIKWSDAAGAAIPHALGAAGNIIQFFVEDVAPHASGAGTTLPFYGGESYQLLGGNSIRTATDTTTSSISVDTSNPNEITVQCYYPAQLSTNQYIYLKTSLQNTAIESAAFDAPANIAANDTILSNILARIAVNTEFIQYDAMADREYFLNIQSKQLGQVQFFLTDSHNRPLGRGGPGTYTAGGAVDANDEFLSPDQGIYGNLAFTAVIRVDVVQQRQTNELETKYPMNNIPSRFVANAFSNTNEAYKGTQYAAPQPIPWNTIPGKVNPLKLRAGGSGG